jgi:hypothetical protein
LLTVEVEDFTGDDVFGAVVAIEHAAGFEGVGEGVGDDLFDRGAGGDVFDGGADGHADGAEEEGAFAAEVDELADAEVRGAAHHLSGAGLIVQAHLGRDATAEQRGCGDAGKEAKEAVSSFHGCGLFSVQSAENQQGKSKEKSDEESGVHSDEEEVVAQVSKMGDAAFGGGEVATGGGEVDDGMAAPDEADGGFGVEVVVAGVAGGVEDAEQGVGGVDAEAEEAVAEIAAEGFEAGEEVGDVMAEEAFAGGGVVELGGTEDEGGGILGRRGHEGSDAVRVMLAIGIHGEDVGEVFGDGLAEAMENGAAFAAVGGLAEDPQVGGGALGEGVEKLIAAVRAAVDHDPDGGPSNEGLAHR